MFVRKFPNEILLALLLVLPSIAGSGKAVAEKAEARQQTAGTRTVVLWRDPVDIASRNLFYGPGGKQHEPRGRFVFVKEDLDGTNPKFLVRDQGGVKWKVKMGYEARPETVASRLVWAVGYFTNEDYFVPELRVEDMPARLHRGQKLVSPDGTVRDVRLKREDRKKVSNWTWRTDPFAGTREWNGLRVLMALLNNWDLKDVNNAVYRVGSEYVYMVSDLGASFGTDNRAWPRAKSKGDLDSYQKSKFLRNQGDDDVSFHSPARPSFVFLVNPKEYFQRVRLEWIGKQIPREDARWMGRLLARLSQSQLRDAFRAAGYTSSQVDAFTSIVESRIAVLTDL